MPEWLKYLIPNEWLNFFIKNWEVLFSGIGILVITTIAGFLRWVFIKKTSPKVDSMYSSGNHA